MVKARARGILVTLLVAAPIVGCGAADDSATRAPSAVREAGMEHIHGLGVRGDTLYIATHTGLWVAPGGQTKARRLGTSKQDVMGFSVVGGDRFIGSGHPDLTQDLPPNLGLIESRDAGRTWQAVSLLGQADFHVLESAGPRVYGFDGTRGRLLVSSDGGRSWTRASVPGPLLSLAIDPRSRDHVVAATENGLFGSRDAGRRWRPLSLRNAATGLLAWPTPRRLFLVDGAGGAQVSSDGGTAWTAVGDIGGQPAAFESHGGDLYVALHDSTVKRSSDGGRTWTVRATP